MNTYKRHRFPADIISYAVWPYYRFNLSHRDIVDLQQSVGLSSAGNRFGFGEPFYIDEVFVKINSKQHSLWRAVDQDDEVVDVYLQAKRYGGAAKRFFKCLIRCHGDEPGKLVTDKLRRYGVAHRVLIADAIDDTSQYANNRAEQSHAPTK